jgi:hypothetical protein
MFPRTRPSTNVIDAGANRKVADIANVESKQQDLEKGVQLDGCFLVMATAKKLHHSLLPSLLLSLLYL